MDNSYPYGPSRKRRARSRSRSAVATAGRASRSASRGRIMAMDVVPARSTSSRRTLKSLMSAYAAEMHEGTAGVGYTALAAGTMALIYINSIVQGDGQNNRDGARIGLDRISCGYSLFAPGSVAAPVSFRTRVVLVWDKTPNGVAPTQAMLLEGAVAGNETFASMPNFNYRDRLVILYDRLHYQQAPYGNVKDGGQFSIDLTGKITTYVTGAGAGTVADCITGGLFLYFLCDSADLQYAHQTQVYFHP